ncbi:MAG: Imm6 family immunity protein [Sporolactobacillus sp.]
MIVFFNPFLQPDTQVAFLLGLSETIVDELSTSSDYENVTHALKVRWEWLEKKQYSGDEIYYLLDDGTESTGRSAMTQRR